MADVDPAGPDASAAGAPRSEAHRHRHVPSPPPLRPILTSAHPRNWVPSLFSIVPEGTSRRRPVDGLELVLAAVIVATRALFASDVSAFEKWLYEWLVGLPRDIQWVFDLGYRVLLPAALLVVLGASLYARRWGSSRSRGSVVLSPSARAC